MHGSLLFVLSLYAVSVTAPADTTLDEADCVFFEHADQQGAYWTAEAGGMDQFSTQLTPWWQDRASSVWIRSGFVLEGYAEPFFKGNRLDMSTQLPLATPMDAGSTLNLFELGFNDQLSSYRCREAGEEISLPKGKVQWFEGRGYVWESGGNHPHHKTLKLQTEGSDLVMLVHADDTYGSNRQDYRVNLSRSTVEVKLVAGGEPKAQVTFDLLLAATRPDLRLTLKDLLQHLRVLAAGYDHDPYAVEPPKPELKSLINYLHSFGG